MNAPPQTTDPLERKAADWVMRHRQGQLSARELEAFQRWQEADPRHAAAAGRADRAWRATASLKRHPGYVKPQRPPRTLWTGSPARQRRALEAEEIARLAESAAHYVALKDDYRK